MFEEFKINNPEANHRISDDGNALHIERPWGDSSLEFRITLDQSTDYAFLDNLRLPPRLSAVIHKDTNDIEFIFGPQHKDEAYFYRSFHYQFNDSDYLCEYADASDSVKNLAKVARAVTPSNTESRNLMPIKHFLRAQASPESDLNDFSVISFYIRNCSLDENELIDFVKRLNFFMRYYDRHSPVVTVHEESTEPTAPALPVQLPAGPFPAIIAGRQLDPHLLDLWEMATLTDPIRRFIYSYQIFEYASFYSIKGDMLLVIKKELMAPNIYSKIDEVGNTLLEIAAQDKTSDEQKISSIILKAVDPHMVWLEIEKNKDFFSKDTCFDGGFKVDRLINAEWTFKDFQVSWSKLPDVLNKIRNAVVHAREKRSSQSILPTVRNRKLLRPFASIALTIAYDLMLYESI